MDTPLNKVPSSLISKLRKISEKLPEVETEKCDFCGITIPSEHRHFADLSNMRFMCACEVCTIREAENTPYRLLPRRYQKLADFNMHEELWGQFSIPVNMAFFVFHSGFQRIVAFYPAPSGATESELKITAWEKLEELNPILKSLEKDVEALLINRTSKPHQYFIVPIDSCYMLIGMIKTTWQGIFGGSEMKNSVKNFFNELEERSSNA